MNPLNLVVGDATVYDLVLAESKAGVSVPLGKGPFGVAVVDPNGVGGTVKVTPGTPDNTTPTSFQLSGTGAVGSVQVTVTDEQYSIVAQGVINVAAAPPPPPPVPDTLTVDFQPAPASAAAAPAVKTA